MTRPSLWQCVRAARRERLDAERRQALAKAEAEARRRRALAEARRRLASRPRDPEDEAGFVIGFLLGWFLGP